METITDWIINNHIEIFGAAAGIIYVFLEIRQNIWLWPVGIVTSAVYIYVFFTGKLYADMSLQGYYLVISVVGWYWWGVKRRGSEEEKGKRRGGEGEKCRAEGAELRAQVSSEASSTSEVLTKGRRDEETEGRRDEETEGRRDEETEGRRDEETEGRRDEETEGRRDEGTEGRRDEETEGRRDEETEGRRDEGTEGRRDEETEGRRDEETEGRRDEETEGWRDEETEGRRDEETEGRRDEETEGRRDEETKGLQVTRLEMRTGIILAVVFAGLYALMCYVLERFTDSPVPQWDSFITSLSIVATWMLARKIYEHWFLWIIVNAAAALLFFTRELYPTVILYCIYLIMSFGGLKEWKKSLFKENSI